MSAKRYKRPHVDIFIYIEMGRERNQGIIKKNTRYKTPFFYGTYERGLVIIDIHCSVITMVCDISI